MWSCYQKKYRTGGTVRPKMMLNVHCGRGDRCLGITYEDTELFDAVIVPLPAKRKLQGFTDEWVQAEFRGMKYFEQETEIPGGFLKLTTMYSLKRIKTVELHEGIKDLEDFREILGKEIRGEQRSWCGWCDRVILAKADKL